MAETGQKFKEEKQWRDDGKKCPIELQIELLKLAFDLEKWDIFSDLLENIKLRIKYRRIEVPFIADIDVLVTSIPHSNVPNKYSKIEIDLNSNAYKAKLAEMQRKGMIVDVLKTEHLNEEIDHCYVFLIYRTTHNPAKAITSVKVVFSEDEKFDSEKLKANQRAIAIPVETANEKNADLTPYLVIEKTSSGLKDEEEKLQALCAIKPFVLPAPYLLSTENFDKIPEELTAFPTDKINSYNYKRDYVFLATQ